MEKYTKPTVNKAKVRAFESSTKKTNCSGGNSRKMPEGRFSTK